MDDMAFADDPVVFAKNQKELEPQLNIWDEALAAKNLKISVNKSKVMVLSRKDKITVITLGNRQIEYLSERF